MTDFLATVIVTFEDSWRWIAFLLIVLAIIWFISLLRDPDKLLGSVKNGVNVIQMDLEKGLIGLEDGFFDHVIIGEGCFYSFRDSGLL